jgi:hypothetical protein
MNNTQALLDIMNFSSPINVGGKGGREEQASRAETLAEKLLIDDLRVVGKAFLWIASWKNRLFLLFFLLEMETFY